jgi:hypothetical protein
VVHVQFPPHVQPSVQVHGVWSLLFSANAAGRPKPASASTAAAIRIFFTSFSFPGKSQANPVPFCTIYT